MDTFELLPTLAQGELSETSAPELVAAVYRSRASGTLLLETRNAEEIRIYFRAGDMCGTGFFSGFHTLAHVLLANDWVNALDIDSSRNEAEATKKRHGEVLVQRGLLTAQQLREALTAQHRHNLTALLHLAEGKYDWRGWEPPPAWTREVSIDPLASIVETLQQAHVDRRERVLAWLGSTRAKLSVDWPEMKGHLALDPRDLRAAGVLAVARNREEFVEASALARDRAESLLAALLLAGGVEPKEGAEAPGASQLPEAQVVEAEPVLDEPVGKPPPPPVQRREEAELELSGDDEPLELATPPRSTTPRETQPLRGMDDDRAHDMRKKMLVRGMRNLGTYPKGGHGEGTGPIETPAEIDEARLRAEDRRLVEEVRERAQLIGAQTPYARLGVTPTSPPDVVRQAYLDAAKKFHPDRATGPLAGVQADLQRIFTCLKEAYDAIGNPEGRSRYEEEHKPGHRSNARREEATLAMRMGEVLLKKKDFDGALNKLRRAVDLDANGDTLAALAWGLMSDPRPGTKEEAASVINRALRAPGVSARTYYVAGVIWRTKDPDSAIDAFRKALEMDPKHPDAALELRLIEQRRGKPPQKGGGVLSGLLFGKRKS